VKLAFHIAHPAQYHLLKNVILVLNENHETLITFNEKDVLSQLLRNKSNKLHIIDIQSGRNGSNVVDLFSQFIKKEVNLYRSLKDFKPDLIIGTSIIIAHVAKLLGSKSLIVNEDDFREISSSVQIGYPFSNNILAPESCNSWKYRNKTIHSNGYHELAYLSPKYFKPDIEKFSQLLPYREKIFLIRLASLSAHHDLGKKGISTTLANKLIVLLERKGRVYITSESELHPSFESKRINIDPLDMHDLLCITDLYIGDSQTMAAEAAVLGTPSIRFNDFVGKLGYLEELEHKYGLTYGIKTSEPEKLLQKIDELLVMPNLKEEWQKRKQIMLADKIDVTAFMVWFIENYPESVKVMKENPDYQYKFK